MSKRKTPSPRQTKGTNPPKKESLDHYPPSSYDDDPYTTLEDTLTSLTDKSLLTTKRSKKKRQGNARRKKEFLEDEQKAHEAAVTRRFKATGGVIAATRAVCAMLREVESGFTEEERGRIRRDLFGDEDPEDGGGDGLDNDENDKERNGSAGPNASQDTVDRAMGN